MLRKTNEGVWRFEVCCADGSVVGIDEVPRRGAPIISLRYHYFPGDVAHDPGTYLRVRVDDGALLVCGVTWWSSYRAMSDSNGVPYDMPWTCSVQRQLVLFATEDQARAYAAFCAAAASTIPAEAAPTIPGEAAPPRLSAAAPNTPQGA